MSTKGHDPKARRRKMIEMYKEGYSLSEICETLEYKDTDYIVQTLKRYGLYKGNRSGIDVPKVLALKKAGWTMKDIVEEFNHDFTVTEINMAIAEEKERSEKRKEHVEVQEA